MTTAPPTDQPATKTAAKKAAAREPDPLVHETIADALAAFQAEMPKVAKGRTANMEKYRYTYADLGDLTEIATPLLVKHGLSWTCLPRRVEGSNGYELVGVLLHGRSDERLEGSLPLIGRGAQELGSSITYNRRYLYGCILGIVTDDDEDGSLAAAAQYHTQTQPDRVIERRATVDTNDPWATPETREQVLERIDTYARLQSIDRESLTEKHRKSLGDMSMETFNDEYPLPGLIAFADSVGKWLDNRQRP